jgi:hypothetical protein
MRIAFDFDLDNERHLQALEGILGALKDAGFDEANPAPFVGGSPLLNEQMNPQNRKSM